jgi:hypothetical protein
VDASPAIDNLVPDNHPLGVYKRKSRTGFIKAEQIKLPSEDTMVSFLGLFEHRKIIIELFFVGQQVP